MIFMLLSLGCVTADNYFGKLGGVLCDKQQECDPEYYEQLYDFGECREEFQQVLDLMRESYGACDFDAQNAKTCLAAYRDLSCAEYQAGGFCEPACGQVYNNCGAGLGGDCSTHDTGP